MIEWISVDERLPDGKEAVLVCYHWSGWENQMELAEYREGEWKIGMFRYGTTREVVDVTHWTELNPPKITAPPDPE